jgi:hypothetical protein
MSEAEAFPFLCWKNGTFPQAIRTACNFAALLRRIVFINEAALRWRSKKTDDIRPKFGETFYGGVQLLLRQKIYSRRFS